MPFCISTKNMQMLNLDNVFTSTNMETCICNYVHAYTAINV